MPVHYSISSATSVVYVKVVGDLSYPDLIEHINQLSEDELYRAPMKNIFDYRLCTNNRLTISETRQYANKKISLSHVFLNEMCAIIAPQDINYGLGRFQEIITSSSNFLTCVFRSLEEGLSWLDIDPCEFQDVVF